MTHFGSLRADVLIKIVIIINHLTNGDYLWWKVILNSKYELRFRLLRDLLDYKTSL